MSKYLDFANNLKLSIDFVSETAAILAAKGAGKTYSAMKLMESMVAGGYQAVAIDPTGVWWGLTSSADGKSAGLDVLIMGGPHAVIPLEPTAGEMVAEFVVDSGRSVVLDISTMRKAEGQRFCAAFLQRLYEYKATHREALHLFMDEANRLAPQKPGKDQLQVLGAAEDVVLQGRSRGLGMTMITQRPAVLNKNLLTQVSSILCLRIGSPQDQDAVKAWLDIHATAEQSKEILGSLGSLGRDHKGDGWWISTTGEENVRITVRQKQTFDSSRTPRPGERAIVPKERTAVDVAKLSAAIKATVERAKENDPKSLKTANAALRAENEKLKKAAEAAAAKTPAVREMVKRVEVAVLKDGQIDKLKAVIDKLQESLVKTGDLYQKAIDLRDGLAVAMAVQLKGQAPEALSPRTQTVPVAGPARPAPSRPPLAAPKREAGPSDPAGESPTVGTGGKRRMLIALAQHPGGLNRTKLSIIADISYSGGTWRTYLGELRGAGWVEGDNSGLRITEDGLAALGDFKPLPTGADLVSYWQGQLGDSGKRAMFDALIDAHPARLTYGELSEKTNIDSGGGTWRTYLGELRGLQLIEGDKKSGLRASDTFFE